MSSLTWLFLFVFEELFAECLAGKVYTLFEGLALLFGHEGVVWHSKGDFGDLVLRVLRLVKAEDYFGRDDAVVEVVELTDLLVGEVLELLCCVEMDGLDCQFHSSFLLFSCRPLGEPVYRFYLTVRSRCGRILASQRDLSVRVAP